MRNRDQYNNLRQYYSLINEQENRDKLLGGLDVSFLGNEENAETVGF